MFLMTLRHYNECDKWYDDIMMKALERYDDIATEVEKELWWHYNKRDESYVDITAMVIKKLSCITVRIINVMLTLLWKW